MNNPIKKYLTRIYFWFSVLFLIGLCCSKFLMSAALILHALTFILFGDYSFFRTRILENRWLFLLLIFWLLHVISLAWSLNLEEGWDAIRVRLSMVSIPFLYAGTLSFSDKEIYQWCKIFILTVAVIISLNIIHFIYINASIGAHDIRQLSWFGSHIRFGILVAFSSAFGLFLWKKKQIGLLPLIVFSIVVFGYVIYSQTFSAILSMAIIVVVFAIYLGSKSLYFKWFFAGGLILIFSLLTSAFIYIATPEPNCGTFQNLDEISKVWEKKSSFPIRDKDKKGQFIQRTAERYICAKNLPLTAASIKLLSLKDIQNIENGNTSPQAITGGLIARLDELRFQIHETKNPNGNSWLQRLEYWKTGWSLIKENSLIGVGIGDVGQALSYKYKALNSPLELKNRKRCHNMFLTTWLGVGILGTVILLSILITLFLIGIQMKSPLLISFVFITGITMLFEDQLETQAGASFFGFFIIILGCHATQNIWRLKN